MPSPIRPDDQIRDFIKIRAEQLGLVRTPALTLEWSDMHARRALDVGLSLYVPALDNTMHVQAYYYEEEIRSSLRHLTRLDLPPYGRPSDLCMAEPLGGYLEDMLCQLRKAILHKVLTTPRKVNINPTLKPL